ncbi:MAG: rRNA pseudouridine synthase [Clostridia bacterium]|nr:rRNA pseudouridine synthase [Clostridia bacterium]
MRINKFLSTCGVASRRKADDIILAGRISVNGKVITELSTDIDENNDRVFLDGKRVQYTSNYIYLMLYKPKGCITSLSDEKGRKTVMDFIPEKYRPYVKPVGRLDYDSEGLLLFTNDGDFAKEITSPASKIKKHYIVKIEGNITRAETLKLSRGVELDENTKTAPAMIKVLEEGKDKTKLEVVIQEGKNREIRRMFESIGKNVVFLKRTQIGMLRLGGLPRGTTKPFDPKYALM